MTTRTTMTLSLLLIAAVSVLLLPGCADQLRGPGKTQHYEPITLHSSDNVTLAAWYYPSSSSKGLIMIHMLAKSKSSYNEYAKELAPSYKIVVLDLRGHGESEGEFGDLTEADFKRMPNDIQAAADYLKSKGVAETDISLVGASVGANLAMVYASSHPADKLVLLSPGSMLRGLDITRMTYEKPLFVQVGNYDAYSSISVDELQGVWPRARIMRYDVSSHGTDLLQYDLSAKEDFLFYLS